MKSFDQFLLKAYLKPDPNPYLFEVGQVVRIKKKAYDNGQTDIRWIGAKATVIQRSCTGIHKDHWYRLEHPETLFQDDFKEEELDRRFASK